VLLLVIEENKVKAVFERLESGYNSRFVIDLTLVASQFIRATHKNLAGGGGS
jgi:hypothetical protein